MIRIAYARTSCYYWEDSDRYFCVRSGVLVDFYYCDKSLFRDKLILLVEIQAQNYRPSLTIGLALIIIYSFTVPSKLSYENNNRLFVRSNAVWLNSRTEDGLAIKTAFNKPNRLLLSGFEGEFKCDTVSIVFNVQIGGRFTEILSVLAVLWKLVNSTTRFGIIDKFDRLIIILEFGF